MLKLAERMLPAVQQPQCTGTLDTINWWTELSMSGDCDCYTGTVK
jgi:hypothetical protein